jgi:hypothetical protein
MANSILTPTAVTREIQRVAHEKATFIGTTNLSYDDSYAQTGAKIGTALKIRKPNKYTVRTGKVLAAQETQEDSVTLTLATQKGVDMNFSSAELTLELDDFSKRIVQPATSVLVSTLESDYLTYVTKKVWNGVGTAGTTPNSMLFFGQARSKLNTSLAPKDDQRYVQINSDAMGTMVNAYSALFHDQMEIKKQYRDGFISRNSGFDWYENDRIWTLTNGSDHTTVTVNDAAIADGDTALTTAGGSVTAGTIFTIASVNAVHPETKQDLGYLQQFVVTADATTSWTFTPAYYATGPNQNVTALPVTAAAITLVGSASTAYEQHLAYHKDAFAFVTADLEMPKGVHFAAREEMDGLSIRLVRQYDINNDNIPARLDILHGYEAIRPEWACRITG